jgi:hypothetical protein
MLRALPASVAAEVRREMAPSHSSPKEVRPEVLNILRWKLEQALDRSSAGRPRFRISNLAQLRTRELLALLDALGASAIARFFRVLSEGEREGFLAGLWPDQRATLLAEVEVRQDFTISEEEGRAHLSNYGPENPSDALRSAGARILARACLSYSPEFASRIVEKNPGLLGRLLVRWMAEERKEVAQPGDHGRTLVLHALEALCRKGVIQHPVRWKPLEQAVAPGHRSELKTAHARKSHKAGPSRGERRGNLPEKEAFSVLSQLPVLRNQAPDGSVAFGRVLLKQEVAPPPLAAGKKPTKPGRGGRGDSE